MHGVEIVVFLLFVIVVFSALVERWRIPQPVMLVVAGLVIGFTPQLPDAELKPDIVFLVFLPPLLFSAALKLSWHDFKAERRSVISLSTGLVFFTTIAIAAVAHYLIPGFTWPLSFLLGAVISPPDAVAATSITKGMNLNKRIVTILEGESLINDASALVAYRYALAAVLTGGFVLWEAGLQFLWVATGGAAVGLLIAWCLALGHKRVRHIPTIAVALTLLTPYVAYLLAEHFHLSGVLAVVAAGLFYSFRAPETFTFQTRMQAYSFWETIEFLLNGFVFILIGMQLPVIVRGLENGSLSDAIMYGVTITSVAVVVRILWVFPGAYLPVWLTRKEKRENIDWRSVLIISWTGMRGVVSLASALAIPLTLADGTRFPQRDMILFITFSVIFLTLVVHGFSLRILMSILKIKPDHLGEQQEEDRIRKKMAAEALYFIDKHIASNNIDEAVLKRLRNKFEINLRIQEARKTAGADSIKGSELLMQYTKGQKDILDHERGLLLELHRDGGASSELLRKLERELDIEDSRLNEQMKRLK